MRFPRTLLLLLALLVPLAVACGDDDDDDGGAALTPTGAASPGASTTPATPTPAPSDPVVEALVGGPGYFAYLVATGDTWVSIGAAFGVAGATIKAENRSQDATPPPGREIAVRLAPAGALAMMPDGAIEQAIGVNGPGGAVVLLQPALALREFYRGRLVLHRVVLADGSQPGEGRGFYMEYYLTDRPAFKGGGIDPDARVVERAFTVGGGSLAGRVEATPPGSIAAFSRSGIPYAVHVTAAAQKTAAEVAAAVQTAAER